MMRKKTRRSFRPRALKVRVKKFTPRAILRSVRRKAPVIKRRPSRKRRKGW
jgi:hypothetical protein